MLVFWMRLFIFAVVFAMVLAAKTELDRRVRKYRWAIRLSQIHDSVSPIAMGSKGWLSEIWVGPLEDVDVPGALLEGEVVKGESSPLGSSPFLSMLTKAGGQVEGSSLAGILGLPFRSSKSALTSRMP